MKHFSLLWSLMLTSQLAFGQNFEQLTAFTPAFGPNKDVNSADMDNDGDKDLLIASSGKVAWFKNTDGQGTFSLTPASETVYSAANAVKAIDMDGDNDLDVLVANGSTANNSNISWIPNTDGTGTLGTAVLITNATNEPRDADAGDLDGDGDLDIVFAGYGDGRFKWCKNNGPGNAWGTPTNLFSGVQTWAKLVKISDIDNDGDNDIMTLVYANSGFAQVAWVKNNGAGTFLPVSIVGLDGNNSFDFAIADINGDGLKDIITSFFNSNAIYWYKNNGDGTFEDNALVVNSFSGAASVLVNDFDDDGDIDIVAASVGQEKIALLKNNGSGVFQPPFYINSNHMFGTVAFGGINFMVTDDFDNDGKWDFAAIGNLTSTVHWFKNVPILPLQLTTTGNFNLTCANSYSGAIYLQISGGVLPYTVSWNQIGLSGDTIVNLLPGNYYCTITDANGSTLTDTFLISSPPQITAEVSTTLAYPNNGTATITNVTGGVPPYSYQWNTGDTDTSIEVPSGVYICTITDAAGCTQSVNAIVNTIDPVVITIDNTQTQLISCFGASDGAMGILIEGGQPPYMVQWSNGSSGPVIEQLPSGNYTCTVTDALGGTGTAVLAMVDPQLITADFQVTHATDGQSNGAITNTLVIGGQGGYSFLWSNGATTSSILGLSPGIYTCTVTDLGKCTYTETFTVTGIVGVSDHLISNTFGIIPNPADEFFRIRSTGLFTVSRVQVYDSRGSMVYTQTGQADIPTAGFAAGLYVVEIQEQNGGLVFKKVMVAH
jgi:FG-GAP-like repeat/Secretion system C-terminal sorting domain/SprB repeat